MDPMPALAVVDIVALVLIAVGGIQGFFRGLSGELARLAGAVIAFIGGTLLHESVGVWVSTHTRLEARPAQTLAYIVTVIIAVLIMIAARMLLKKMIQGVFAPGFDKTAGVLAGLLRMSIFTCIFFIIMNMIPSEYLNRKFGGESAVGSFMIRYVPTVENTLEAAGIPAFRRQPTEEPQP
jgi:uncharacterized membrane protein required for colicin V production